MVSSILYSPLQEKYQKQSQKNMLNDRQLKNSLKSCKESLPTTATAPTEVTDVHLEYSEWSVDFVKLCFLMYSNVITSASGSHRKRQDKGDVNLASHSVITHAKSIQNTDT